MKLTEKELKYCNDIFVRNMDDFKQKCISIFVGFLFFAICPLHIYFIITLHFYEIPIAVIVTLFFMVPCVAILFYCYTIVHNEDEFIRKDLLSGNYSATTTIIQKKDKIYRSSRHGRFYLYLSLSRI